MRTVQKLAAMMGFLMAMSGLASGQTSKVESTETVRTEVTSIPYETHFELSRRVGAGRTLRSQEGKPGQIIRDYVIVKKGGKEVSKTLMYEERIEPVHEVFLVGREGYLSMNMVCSSTQKRVMRWFFRSRRTILRQKGSSL